jgi:molybdopterin-guanine dinucleotide biosynthesis protein A
VADEVVQVGGVVAGDEVVVPDPGEGPFLGVLALLRSGRGDRYVIAAVDQPLLDAPTLRRLLDVDAGVDAGVAFADEPIPCVLPATARPRIEAAAAAGERRLRALATTTVTPTTDERRCLRNVNRPEDLASLRARPAD